MGQRTTGTRFYDPLLVNEKGVKELPSLMSQSIQSSSSASEIELTIKFNLIVFRGFRGSNLIRERVGRGRVPESVRRQRHIFFLSHTDCAS